jgi:heat shock protein HtpX
MTTSSTLPTWPRMPTVPASGHAYLRTALLMSALIVLLCLGGRAWGGLRGMILFGSFGLVFNFFSYWFSDRIALRVHRARPVSREEAPGLYRIVERLTTRASLPMPSLHVIPTAALNAFATGRSPSHAAVAVTSGILGALDERELEGVLAHELSHVRNRDVLIATVAAAVAGLISSLGYLMRWGALFGGYSSRDDRRGGGLEVLVWALVAPIIALILQLSISRSREYAADASGAALSGDPDPLADALLKLERASERAPYPFAGPATAHLFIVNPLKGSMGALSRLFSTHPPLEGRIARLRQMKSGLSSLSR